jgi:tetratricopeptide (TPR) repeat protein
MAVLADDALDQAEALHLMVQRDPQAAAQASRDLLGRLPRTGQAAPRCVATWALGRALFEMGEIDAALVELRRAVASAGRRHDARTRARVQGTLAWALVEAGRSGAALTVLRHAEAATPPEDLGRLLTQRVLVHFHRGELSDAVRAADRALDLLRAHHDSLGEVRLLVNRSIVWLNAGRPGEAERDLAAARPIAVRLGQDLIVVGIDHNLAVAAGRRGRIPESLRRFEVAARGYEALGSAGRSVAILEVDRAEVLLHAGLHREAARAAATAADLSGRAGHAVSAAESLLLQARALAEVGSEDAASAARAAATAFRQAGRRNWLVLARALEWEIDSAGSQRPRIARGRDLARALAEAGWVLEGQRLAALVALRSLERGTSESRIPELTDAPARRRAGPAWLRARWWYVEAVRRWRRHERRPALVAIEAGLRAIDDHRRAFDSLELRVGASSFGVPLATLALEIASAEGDARSVLRWAERWRASALATRPTRPPGAALTDALTALRTHHAALSSLGPDDPGYRRTAAALTRAESDVRRLARSSEGRAAAGISASALRDLGKALEDAVLVAYHEHDERVAAVVVRDGTTKLVDVGSRADVESESDHLAAAVHRGILYERAAIRVGAAATLAEETLLHGIDLGGERPVVIVPVGPLHKVPWGLLPALSGRPLTVTPSASTWLALRRAAATVAGRSLLVAGPTLDGAEREVQELGGILPDAVVVGASDSRVADVVELLEGVDLVHVAAHGTFRSDNPMLSSLQLADGPLTVYDLDQLRSVPSTVVLSACSAGTVATSRGAEVLGTVTVLLDRGVGHVVAPVTVLPDWPARTVMCSLYAGLAAGESVPVALAAVRRSAGAAGSPRDIVVAGVLTCFGH